jgi:hypothetical protein
VNVFVCARVNETVVTLYVLMYAHAYRIVQCGANSGGNDCLFIGGFELYGTLIDSWC